MAGVGIGPVGTLPIGGSYVVVSGALAMTVNGVVQRGGVSSSKIDDTTRDYELDEYGNEVAMSDSGQRVYLLLKTSYGSIANDTGLGLQKPSKLGANAGKEVEAFVRQALSPATDDESIKLEDVQVETDGPRLYALIRWRDLRTDEVRSTPFPLS